MNSKEERKPGIIIENDLLIGILTVLLKKKRDKVLSQITIV